MSVKEAYEAELKARGYTADPAQLRAVVAETRAAWLASLIGTQLSVLAERDGTGHAENFARVHLPADTMPGTIVTLTPTRIDESLLA